MKLNISTLSAFAAAATLAFTAGAALAQPTQDPAQVKGGDFVLDTNHGKITWSVNHLGYSIYAGQFYAVSGKLHLDAARPEASALDITVDTAKVGTFNTKLDEELASPMFLDAPHFPTATYHATRIERTGPKTALIHGELTLHGVTRPVNLEATFLQAGANPMSKIYEVGFEGHTVIKRSEFGVKTYVPFVSDDVTLQLEGEFKAAQ